MSEPTLALQGAVYTALHGNTTAGANVFDRLTPNVFPRIQIGQGMKVRDDSSCVDGWHVYFQIDVYSNADGYREAKLIAGDIERLLHKQDFAVPNYNVVDVWTEGAVFSREADGVISRARIDVEATMEAA
ncbi:DUF3168 domain-containing protein [Aquamicrobium lusatiense]|uniref:DUF3168 domain-containing protein n=1 Tax=Aquamicrobium lusatiense TaxID=89772 RepID=UPI002457833D|nr:DUF3168 domain-containing protein [Aquamicrobium lusatiense]MDH4993304.1 DUF3168 domain-containing protein [Aquamicrobium lusatiense]